MRASSQFQQPTFRRYVCGHSTSVSTNLFIACGLVGGVAVWMSGNEAVGRALVTYLCLFAFLAGIALFASDRLAMSRPRGKGVGGALAQGVPPLIALIAALL
jgi:putative membrane protein